MHLQFREYLRSDRDACIEVFQTNVPRYFREHELNEYLQFIDAGRCPYFVVDAAAGTLACGGFGFRPGSDTADLCWGMVDAEHHGRRLGEFLLLARLQRIVTHTHAQSVRLGTSQLTANFFLKYGFTIKSRAPDGIAEGLDDVQMRLDLTEDRRTAIQRCCGDIDAIGG